MLARARIARDSRVVPLVEFQVLFGTRETRMRRLFFVVVAALMVAVAGCSSSPSAGNTPSPSQPTSSTAATTPTPATAAPDATCLNGRYQLVRFDGVGDRKRYGAGEGGDVTITFADGSYLLHGAGKDPIKLTLAGLNADLLVNGTISGDHRVTGNQAVLTVGESSGSMTLSKGWLKESVPMEQVGSVLATNSEAELACANDALLLTLQDLRLEFGKV